jgi:hypothetical protein
MFREQHVRVGTIRRKLQRLLGQSNLSARIGLFECVEHDLLRSVNFGAAIG